MSVVIYLSTKPYILIYKLEEDIQQQIFCATHQDPENPQTFVWSEVYANDKALSAHVSNPPVQEYLQKHVELGDGFRIEVCGTVADECRRLMESFGLLLKIFEFTLSHSRV